MKMQFRSSTSACDVVRYRIEDAISVDTGDTQPLAVTAHFERSHTIYRTRPIVDERRGYRTSGPSGSRSNDQWTETPRQTTYGKNSCPPDLVRFSPLESSGSELRAARYSVRSASSGFKTVARLAGT